MRQTSYDYNFGYDKVQVFEIPNLSTTILNPDPEKEMFNSNSNSQSSRKKASSGKKVTKENKGSKAKKSRADLAKNIEGTYRGNGKLLLGKTQDDFFSNISVILERVDKNHVNVTVIENDEEFFETPLLYTCLL